MQKKILNTLALASLMSVAAGASAQSSSELQVHGTLVPGACLLTADRNSIDLGTIAADTLSEGSHRLPRQRIGVAVACPDLTNVGFYFSDTGADSLPGTEVLTISSEREGTVSTVGFYQLRTVNGRRDGVPTDVYRRSVLTNLVWVNDPTRWMQFFGAEPYRNGSFDIDVAAEIFQTNVPISDETALRGSMAIELVYL